METYLVQGCGVSLICEKGKTMRDWLLYIVDRGGVPTVMRWAAQLTLLLVVLVGASHISSAANPQDLDQMTSYANNAILDAAQSGHKSVTLKFGNTNPNLIEKLADSLRDRGYVLDEEANLLNPCIVKIQRLKNAAMVRRFPESR